MNILHVINTCDPKSGGPIEGIKQLYQIYKKKNIYAEILSSDTLKKAKKFQLDLPLINATGPSKSKFNFNPNLLKWLKKNIHRFDHIIIEGIWLYHNYAVWKVAVNKKIPYSIFPHGSLDPWFKKKYPIKHFKKKILWYVFQKKIFQNANNIFFTTNTEKELAYKTFNLKNMNCKVLNYGINGNVHLNDNLNLFYLKYPKLKSKKIIVFMSRIHEKKGLDILIKTFLETSTINQNLHLVIAGTGEKQLIKKLKSLIPQNKKKDITWTGILLGKIKWDLLKCSYLFCLPSHQENFGISVAEALSSKIPVLITNEINIHKKITEYNAGIVSQDKLNIYKKDFKKIIELLKINQKKISNNSLNCFKNEFYIENYYNKLIKNLIL